MSRCAAAALLLPLLAAAQCPRVDPLPPIRERHDLGAALRARGLTGHAAELGVHSGGFTATILRGWRTCDTYTQVDAWRDLGRVDEGDESQLVSNATHEFRRGVARRVLDAAVALGYAKAGDQCVDLTENCVEHYPLDYFDFIYVDASHDRVAVLFDLHLWWPRLRKGGVMAGHDYTEQREPPPHAWAEAPPDDAGAWPEPFDADHSLPLAVDAAGGLELATRDGESRAEAAARFAADVGPVGGAGCEPGDAACVARAVLASDAWQSSAPVRPFRAEGYADACLPLFGENGCGTAWDPESTGQNWTRVAVPATKDIICGAGNHICGPGYEDSRAVRGAVDDFFSGTAYSPPDLVACPRQVSVAYRERGWNTWMVAK